MLHTIRNNRSRRVALILGLAILMIGVALKINHREYADMILLAGGGVLLCIALLFMLGKIKKPG